MQAASRPVSCRPKAKAGSESESESRGPEKTDEGDGEGRGVENLGGTVPSDQIYIWFLGMTGQGKRRAGGRMGREDWWFFASVPSHFMVQGQCEGPLAVTTGPGAGRLSFGAPRIRIGKASIRCKDMPAVCRPRHCNYGLPETVPFAGDKDLNALASYVPRKN